MSDKIDEAETKAAEYMIRYAAALHREGRNEQSKEVTQVALKTFRYTIFNAAVVKCDWDND